jgi:hypothetical protein
MLDLSSVLALLSTTGMPTVPPDGCHQRDWGGSTKVWEPDAVAPPLFRVLRV